MASASIRTATPDDTARAGKLLAGSLSAGAVVILTGTLGAGKTVFVKGMAAGLGIGVPVTSPSYTIAAVYEGTLPLTHIDLYRTSTYEELELLGFDELGDTSGITVVEWGEKAMDFFDGAAVRVIITIMAADERRIEISNISDELSSRISLEFTGKQ